MKQGPTDTRAQLTLRLLLLDDDMDSPSGASNLSARRVQQVLTGLQCEHSLFLSIHLCISSVSGQKAEYYYTAGWFYVAFGSSVNWTSCHAVHNERLRRWVACSESQRYSWTRAPRPRWLPSAAGTCTPLHHPRDCLDASKSFCVSCKIFVCGKHGVDSFHNLPFIIRLCTRSPLWRHWASISGAMA